MTGAPLPDGADAVVPVEDTDFAPALAADLPVYPPSEPGEHLPTRPGPGPISARVGQDVHQGQVLLTKGRKIQPQDVGILASTGQAFVRVFRRPRVALFSSGDELVQPGQPLGPGQIYDSNQYVLAAMLEKDGAKSYAWELHLMIPARSKCC